MKAIENRKDVSNLVHCFYGKVRADKSLGPIFNQSIDEEQWPAHLEKMTDFWMGNLLGTKTFKGEPIKAHVTADNNADHSITQLHFARWIQLWFETIDEHFVGAVSAKAKDVARILTTPIYMAIWENQQAQMKRGSGK